MKCNKMDQNARGVKSRGLLLLWLSLTALPMLLCMDMALASENTEPLPLAAKGSLVVSQPLRLDEYTTATFSITPDVDVNHFRVVVKGDGVEISGGVRILTKGVEKDGWSKVLVENGTINAGRPQTYQLQIRPLRKNSIPVSVFVEAGETFSVSTPIFKKRLLVGQTWVLANEASGTFITWEEHLRDSSMKSPEQNEPIYNELSNTFPGKLENLLQLFLRDEAGLSRSEALYLVDKSYFMVLRSMNRKDSPYCNPNKAEDVDVPVGRAVRALQAEAAKHAMSKGKPRLDIYREMIKQWKAERSRLKSSIHKSEGRGGPPTILTNMTLTGTWLFKKHLCDSVGGLLETTVDKPMRQVLVHFWERDSTGVNHYLAQNVTDNNGNYSVTGNVDPLYYWHIVFPVVLCDGPSWVFPEAYRVIVIAPTRSQWPPEYGINFQPVWKYHLTGQIVPYNAGTVDFGTHYFWEDSLYPTCAEPPGGAANIYNTLLNGYEYVTDTLANAPIGSVRVMWEPHYTHATGWGNDTIWVRGNPFAPYYDTDEWDDAFLLHEYGHHVMAKVAEFPPATPQDHRWQYSYPANKNLAYKEAWPFYFSAQVRSDVAIVDTKGRIGMGGTHPPGWLHIEDPWASNTFPPGEFQASPWCEGAVAGTLWDMYDAVNEQYQGGGEDSIGIGQYPEIRGYMWQDFKNWTVTQESPGVWHKNYWIFDFVSGWTHSIMYSDPTEVFGHEEAIRTISNHHGISWDPPQPPTGLTVNGLNLVWNRSPEGDRWGYNIYNRPWLFPTTNYARDNAYVNLDPDTTYTAIYWMWPQEYAVTTLDTLRRESPLSGWARSGGGGGSTDGAGQSGKGVVVLPKVFDLAQNAPNGFSDHTDIRYALPRNAHTSLKVYNLKGELVMTLVEGVKKPGFYQVQWKGTDSRGRRVASGVYFYRMEAGPYTNTRKMVVVR